MKHAVYVIGDIHGENTMLQDIIIQINDHKKTQKYDKVELVFLGDYVDRGPDSEEVLELVMRMTKRPTRYGFDVITALMGNHEEMMYLAYEDYYHRRLWLMNGGVRTLESFGISDVNLNDQPERYKKYIKWISELPKYYELGKCAFAHAGIDHPQMSCAEHESNDLLWSRKLRAKPHEIYDYTVHGHTPFSDPMIGENVAYIDTCAFSDNGKLTCLYIPDVNKPVSKDMEVLQVEKNCS